MTATVLRSDMTAGLRTLDEVRRTLAATEPLATRPFTVGDEVRFTVDDGWQHGLDARPGTDPVDAFVHLGRGPGSTEHRLTKDALLEATSFCGMTKTYASRLPAQLLTPHLNYWFREGLLSRNNARKDFQLLVAAGHGAAITRATIQPFSNLRLLDESLAAIGARYGDTDVLCDYKFVHTLRRTHLRLILPARRRTITGTGVEDDEWSVGLQLKNSLIGEERTSIDGYLFRWWCTNGAIDTHATSGVWSRRGNTPEDEVYDWARTAVDNVLGGLEPALDAVQETVGQTLDGHATDILRDVFTHYRVPLPERARITEALLNSGDRLTMYHLMQAITQVANDPALEPSHVESLMRMGGDLPHAASSTCGSCRRLLPH